MKVRSTMYYGERTIAQTEWELDDKASKVNRTFAALSIEDYLREPLTFEHQVLSEDEKNVTETGEIDSETGQSCDCTVQSEGGGEHSRVGYRPEID